MNSITEILFKHRQGLDEAQLNKLSAIADSLCEESLRLNLTALKNDEEIAILHLYDSLSLLDTGLFKNQSVIDVGCGAGFPAFPLAVCSDNCMVTANDSTKKKLDFIEKTAVLAGLENIKTLFGRAEELSRTGLRESFNIAVSRGVARLNILCELCLPLVKPGGYFIAMKGSKGGEELDEAKTAIRTLSGELTGVVKVRIPVFDREHCLIIIKKTGKISEQYPRLYPKILKNAL